MDAVRIRSVQPEGRYRAGRCWTAKGVVVGRDELDADAWEAIAADPILRAEPAELEDQEAAAGAEAEIVAAIGRLAPEDFDAQGRPKLDALRIALPGVKVSAARRDEVWARIKAGASAD